MSKLLNAFEFNDNNSNITDYDSFKDKELLERLRKDILSSISDKNKSNSIEKEVVIETVNEVCGGYNFNEVELNYLYNMIMGELDIYGPLTDLINDKEISEIMVNAPDEIYVEINGKIVKENSVSFINNEHILRTIQKIIEPVGRKIDSSTPMVDARLKEGSRLNAIIPPLSIKGPILTIRKFKKNVNDIEDLIRIGTLTPYMANFLDACVRSKLNIIICGGTGSGKTTLLNVLSSSIMDDERIITIEDAAELNLNKSLVISLETRNNNYENNGEVKIRDLLINSLRMRPDRIIVGEVRGNEAFDMLQAMNTGHEGSLSTIHANSAKDALNRLESCVMLSSDKLPVNVIRDYISSTIDLIINIERLSDGKRKITSISEITGIKNGEIIVQDIFAFIVKGITPNNEVDGEFVRYDYTPKCLDKIHRKGINDIDYIFNK